MTTKSKWLHLHHITRFGLPPLHRPISSSSSRLKPDIKAADVMHAHLLKTAYMLPAANSLLASYDPASAAKMFDQMPLRDHVSWTTVIGACRPAQAVALFRRMRLDPRIRVDGVLLVVLLRASATLRCTNLGSSLHAMATRRGLLLDVFVANSLVHMYGECLQLLSARKVFDAIAHKNVVSWNTMLSGLLHADCCAEALHLLHHSTRLHLEADATTLAVLLQLCKKLARPVCCRSLHALALRKLLLMASTPLLNALLDAYAKCALVDHALRLFHQTPLGDRDVVTWSTVIAACACSGSPQKAMSFFAAMTEAGQRPNSITMLSLLEACASRAEIGASRCAHGVALRSGLASDLGVGNAIVDMYGKCGDLATSRRVFDAMPAKDVLSWNSMIGALGMNGRASDALGLAQEMERGGAVKPNGVTLLAVLSACAHGGLLQEGVACLERLVREYSVQADKAHLTCIADMLARSGDVNSAAKIARAAGPAAWSAVLSGCRTTTNEVAEEATWRVVELEPDNSAGYLLAAMDKRGMRRMMRERGVKVSSGYSVVHVGGEEHSFASWDGRHLHRVQVYDMLHLLHSYMMREPTDDLL